jgi:tetratricopeptide (TPR) repeat protein
MTELAVPTVDFEATANRTRADLVAAGRFEDAIEFLERCVDAHPESHRALVLLGIEYSRMYRFTDAVDCYERALQLTPDDHIVLGRFGQCLTKLGQVERAQHAYERALAADAADPIMAKRYWHVVRLTRDFNRAVPVLRSAFERTGDPEIGTILAACVEASGAADAAVDVLVEVTRDSPEVVDAAIALGRLFNKSGRSAEAIALLTAATTRNPNDLQANLVLADALLGSGRAAEALDVLDHALASRPNTSDLWTRKAIALEAAHHIDDATKCHQRAADAKARIEAAMAAIAQAQAFDTRWDLINHCVEVRPEKGLVLEFGVAAGISARYLANRVPQVYGFDSFAGLPEDTDRWSKGQFAQQKLPEVPPNVDLVVGWYDATLEPFLTEHSDTISMLHIDCDIYSSTKYVLDEVRDRLIPGSVILFDELWKYGGWENHEWRALEECLLSRGVTVEYIGWHRGGPQVAVQMRSAA